MAGPTAELAAALPRPAARHIQDAFNGILRAEMGE